MVFSIGIQSIHNKYIYHVQFVITMNNMMYERDYSHLSTYFHTFCLTFDWSSSRPSSESLSSNFLSYVLKDLILHQIGLHHSNCHRSALLCLLSKVHDESLQTEEALSSDYWKQPKGRSTEKDCCSVVSLLCKWKFNYLLCLSIRIDTGFSEQGRRHILST